MLIEIQCDKFISNGAPRDPIKFHDGLNAVLGDSNRSNSIGKSTLLMIIDFVFGGNDYVKRCTDVQENVKEHTINFTFKFGDELFYFARNNIEHQKIIICDSDYKPLEGKEALSLDEYRVFLKEKYNINISDLSWRSTISRFIRVYNRDTIDETKPLKSAKSESEENAIKQYMLLFDRYAAVEAQIKQAAKAEDEKETFRKSQQYEYIRIAKNDGEFKANEARIVELQQLEEKLAEESDHGLLDLDSVKAHRLSTLNDELAAYRRQRAKVQTQLNAIRKEMTEGKKSFKRTYSDLERFFPEVDFKTIEEIERFHQKLSKVLVDEFKETESSLATAYVMLGNEIVKIKDTIAEIENVPNVTQAVLKEYARITTELNTLTEANKNYTEMSRLKKAAEEYAKTRDEVIKNELSFIETTVNDSMRLITYELVKNKLQLPPSLRLEKLTKYTFTTPNDGGSGAQFRGLVAFDLANLEVSPVPFIVHDSDILDPIEKPALTEIVKAYNAQAKKGKQVFASFRSLDFYEEEAQKIIEAQKVLELSSGGNELFGWAWNKETDGENNGE